MSYYKKIALTFLIICSQIITIYSQGYTASYKPLTSDILTGTKPIKIGILEDFTSGEKLYEGLVQDNAIKKDYEIYPSSVLNANKEMLGGELNAENNNFLKLLNDILRIKYLLQWQALPDSAGFQLTIYSTNNFNKLYENKFYASLNSNPVNDVKKFLTEKVETSYKITFGELQVNATPESAKYKLYKDTQLIKEWSGNEKQKVEAGNYKLTSDAYGFNSNSREINITGQNPTVINIKLEPDISLMPNISSSDNIISNINSELQSDQLKIFYDLNGEKGSAYNIKIMLTNKKNNNSNQVKQVVGDIENVIPGKSKVIIWQFSKELDNNNLNNYDLKLSADKVGKGIAWYIYAGGGALLLGGGAALLLKGSDTGTPAERVKINPPPGRP